MKTKEITLPKWFTGILYTSGDTVTNPYSSQSIELDPIALSMYDFIWGCVIAKRTNHKYFNKAMSWFMKNYPEAYMVLLD